MLIFKAKYNSQRGRPNTGGVGVRRVLKLEQQSPSADLCDISEVLLSDHSNSHQHIISHGFETIEASDSVHDLAPNMTMNSCSMIKANDSIPFLDVTFPALIHGTTLQDTPRQTLISTPNKKLSLSRPQSSYIKNRGSLSSYTDKNSMGMLRSDIPNVFPSSSPTNASLSARLNASITVSKAKFPANESIDTNNKKDTTFLGNHISPLLRTGPTVNEIDDEQSALNLGDEDASTVFENMKMDDILDYLLSAKDQSLPGGRPFFIYVIPRHHVENIKRENFYDLVALEKPGGKAMKNLLNDLSSAGKRPNIMQLSLYGLLIGKIPKRRRGKQLTAQREDVREEDELTEFIPLRQFIKEKQQVEFLRSGRFFGFHRELKTFCAWKCLTRSRCIDRTIKNLLNNTFFREVELVQAQQKVTEICHRMESDTELFYFHGKGAINISDFLMRQIELIDTVQNKLHAAHNNLTDLLHALYVNYQNGGKLDETVKIVKNLHPFKEIIQKKGDKKTINGQSIPEWMELRSIQRVSLSFKEKVAKIYILAQYKFDYTVAVILEKFWLRFKLFITGVSIGKVNVNRRTWSTENTDDSSFSWPLDMTHFDSNGNPISSFFGGNIESKVSDGLPLNDEYDGENLIKMLEDEGEDDGPGPGDGEVKTAPGKGRSDFADIVKIALDQYHGGSQPLYKDGKKMAKKELGLKISREFEENGSHLKICINLMLDGESTPCSLPEIIQLNSVERLKVRIRPSKNELMSQMHTLCGSIGTLLEHLPNLKRHNFILQLEEVTVKVDAQRDAVVSQSEAFPELGLGIIGADDVTDANISKSSKYFTCLVVHPIFNSTNAYNLAVDCLNLARKAYLEASKLDHFFIKLMDVVNNLWHLTPQVLAKQIERSLVLGKLKDYIENPFALEDLKRLNLRDNGRLTAIRRAETYLDESVLLLDSMADIKFRLGFIVSFQPILMQLRLYRTFLEKTLYERLPMSFSNRSRHFYDYLTYLERLFSHVSTGLDDLILLMKRIKNFEKSKDSYNLEIEVCDSLFSIIQRRQPSSVDNGDASLLKSVEVALALYARRRASSTAGRIDPSRMHQAMLDAIDRLLGAMNKARSILLSQVQQMKGETISRKLALHKRIAYEVSQLNEFYKISSTKNSVEIADFVHITSATMVSLRQDVDALVSAQSVLVEAHEIIGTASSVLLPREVDKFSDMDQIELLYTQRCSAWQLIQDCNIIKRNLLGSKLSKANNIRGFHLIRFLWYVIIITVPLPQDISSRFQQIETSYQALVNAIQDDGILAMVAALIATLRPKIELVVCLGLDYVGKCEICELNSCIACALGLVFVLE